MGKALFLGMPMPTHCIDCDKPINEVGFQIICKNCKKKESTKERKMDSYNIYNIYIYNII